MSALLRIRRTMRQARIGQFLPPSAATDWSSVRLLYSDTCRKPYACNSAIAATGGLPIWIVRTARLSDRPRKTRTYRRPRSVVDDRPLLGSPIESSKCCLTADAAYKYPGYWEYRTVPDAWVCGSSHEATYTLPHTARVVGFCLGRAVERTWIGGF